MNNTNVVNKLWGFCHILRHDGIDYGDYVEQLTYLLFLKMAEEKRVVIPKEYSWQVLKSKSGTELTDFYSNLLRGLSKQEGLLGAIFVEALSKFTKPVNLKKLIDLIDEIDWTGLDVDVKAEAYEGLLEKSAAEGKKGAGQYFTPRILIRSIVSCIKPDPRKSSEFTISDPAAGTGGFLLASYEWFMNLVGDAINRDDLERIRKHTYFGTELVARPRRLALMNLYLHGIESEIRLGDSLYEPDRGDRYDVVLTNPPFGTKGANQIPERQDFTVGTTNKQLNFVQHILTILKPGGRAAIVLPDNVLFADQAGEVFKILMQDCNLHTVLRLPRGTFTPYSPGVKANVIFFTKGLLTQTVWIYDARTNVPSITKKDRPLTPEHFAAFEKCYGDNPNGQSQRKETDSKENRWRKFSIEVIKHAEYKLDSIKWLKEDEENNQEVLDIEGFISETAKELEGTIALLESIKHEAKISINSKSMNWRRDKLSNIAERITKGSTPTSYGFNFQASGIPFIKIENINNGSIDHKSIKDFISIEADNSQSRSKLQEGDILFSIAGTIGVTCLVKKSDLPANTNQALAIIRGTDKVFNPKFLQYQLQSWIAKEQANNKARGGGMNNISLGDVGNLEVVIPPLEEQQRIVKKIETLVSLAQQATHNSNTSAVKIENLLQSILAKAFRGELIL